MGKVKGGNTNLYKRKISPKRVHIKRIRYHKRTLPINGGGKIARKRKGKVVYGGGIFSFLSAGLKKVGKKVLKQAPSVAKLAKRVASQGANIAKQQLKKPEVQKALSSAVKDITQLATHHIIQKINQKGNTLTKQRTKQRLKQGRKKSRRRRGILFQSNDE